MQKFLTVISKKTKHHQTDYLLHYFQLGRGIGFVPNAVGRHLKAILHKGNEPGNNDHLEHRRILVLQVAIPGNGHKNVGERE